MVKSRCYLGCEEDNPIYFGFPTSRPKYKKWLSLMNITSKVTNDDVLCHRHFASTDYECIRGKMRLKKNVMPTLSPGEPQISTNTENITSETAQTKSSTSEPDSKIETEEKPPDETTQIPPDKPDHNGVITESTSQIKTSKVTNSSKEQTNKCDSDSSSVLSCSEDSVQFDSIQQSACRQQIPDELKEDIEDIITNYQIRNKKPNKLVSPPRELEPVVVEELQVEPTKQADPVFIEVSVGQDPHSSNPGAGNQDCLMVLESVQVELDPATLLLPERDEDDDSDDDVQEVESKVDPISLLTSSDEDEVIIQEPKIDTVEVSSGTDEDDVPLVKLVKTKSKRKSNYRPPTDITQIMWGLYEYYCLQCKYNTTSKSDYTRHLKSHETVLHVCQICGYTTSSKPQFWRHKRKHKDEKRFKCHLCEYKARHSMSLVYHLKSHERSSVGVTCKKCGMYFIETKTAVKHIKSCDAKGRMYPCKVCPYATKRPADLRRHVRSRHGDDDTDYTPTYFVFYFQLI